MCVRFSLSASPSVPLDITVTHISDTSFSEGERVTSIVVADSIQPKFDGKLFITGLNYNASHFLLTDISATVTVKNTLQTTNYYQYGTITETQGRQACVYA